ncbi:glycoside hydrolase [Ramicandelaber brevisporus]|nr:glycoside hydrolase [Ramicandelaber brevisporus]
MARTWSSNGIHSGSALAVSEFVAFNSTTARNAANARALVTRAKPAKSKLTADSESATSASKASPVVVGYYADWSAGKLPPEQIPFSKLTHINYAFASIDTSTFTPKVDTPELLDKVVTLAHQNQQQQKRVLISVGGWSSSGPFSGMTASASGRSQFADAVVNFVDKHKLDGVDIDDEFIGRQGASCTPFDKNNDAKNMLLQLQELRSKLDAKFGTDGPGRKEITMAVRVEPFDGPDGIIKDMTEFSKVVDFVNVMAYDLYGSWSSSTGPNAPFSLPSSMKVNLESEAGQVAPAAVEPFSYQQAINSWLDSKWPPEKLVMGLALYGRSATVTVKGAISGKTQYLAKAGKTPKGDSDDDLWTDPCPGSKPVFSGVWQWRHLVDNGALASTAESDKAGQGWIRHWDEVAQTPWLFRQSDNTFVSYDDPKSIGIKVDEVRKRGLRGVMFWALAFDPKAELVSIASQSLLA